MRSKMGQTETLTTVWRDVYTSREEVQGKALKDIHTDKIHSIENTCTEAHTDSSFKKKNKQKKRDTISTKITGWGKKAKA